MVPFMMGEFKMEMLTIEEATLRSVQTFESVAAMNEAVRAYKQEYALSQTDIAILDAISRYACKYTGVCFLSKQGIAEEAGFTSRRTAIRACNRMEKLGMMKQYETRRVSGDKRQSANIIVIQPADLEEDFLGGKPEISATKCGRENASIPLESQGKVTAGSHTKEALYKTSLQTNTYKETCTETDELLKRGLKTSIPEAIYNAFSPFFDGKTLYEMYGVLLRAKANVNAMFMVEDYAEEYMNHFFNVIRLYKKGKVKNLASYLYVTWERLSSEISRRRKGDSKWLKIFGEESQGVF